MILNYVLDFVTNTEQKKKENGCILFYNMYTYLYLTKKVLLIHLIALLTS